MNQAPSGHGNRSQRPHLGHHVSGSVVSLRRIDMMDTGGKNQYHENRKESIGTASWGIQHRK